MNLLGMSDPGDWPLSWQSGHSLSSDSNRAVRIPTNNFNTIFIFQINCSEVGFKKYIGLERTFVAVSLTTAGYHDGIADQFFAYTAN